MRPRLDRLRAALTGVALAGVLGLSTATALVAHEHHATRTVALAPAPAALPASAVLPDLPDLPDLPGPGEDSPPVPPATTAPAAPAPPTAAMTAARQVAGTEGAGTPPVLAPIGQPGYAKEPPAASSVAPVRSTLAVSATPGGRPVVRLSDPTDKGAPLHLLVLDHGTGPATGWDRVALEQRPNGTYGWVRAADVTETADPWRVTVLQGRHRVLVWYAHSLMADQPAAVGASATPTPYGVTYVDVLVDTGNPAGAYGRWILGLAAHSDVYQTFGAQNGDALIGLHGTDETDSIGHSVSHGCIRLPNAFAAELAHVIPLGTRVSIEP